MDDTPFGRLVEHFGGSQAEVARALSRSPQVISNWKRRGIPAEAALDIERATRGEISAVDILRRLEQAGRPQ